MSLLERYIKVDPFTGEATLERYIDRLFFLDGITYSYADYSGRRPDAMISIRDLAYDEEVGYPPENHEGYVPSWMVQWDSPYTFDLDYSTPPFPEVFEKINNYKK